MAMVMAPLLRMRPRMPHLSAPTQKSASHPRVSSYGVLSSPSTLKLCVENINTSPICCTEKIVACDVENIVPPKKKAFIWVAYKKDLVLMATALWKLGYEVYSMKNTSYILEEHISIKLIAPGTGQIDPKKFDVLVVNLYDDGLRQKGDIIPLNLELHTFMPAWIYKLNTDAREDSVVAVDPEDYKDILFMLEGFGESSGEFQKRMRKKAKEHFAVYFKLYAVYFNLYIH